MMRRLVLLTLSLVFLFAPTEAHAGNYHVSLCEALKHPESDAYHWTLVAPRAGFNYAAISCDGGGLYARVNSTATTTAAGVMTGWSLTLPPPLTVNTMDVDFTGSVTLWSGWETTIWGARPGAPQWIDILSCAGTLCTPTPRDMPMYGMAAIAFGLGCGVGGCSAGSYASIDVSYMRLNVTDPIAPETTAMSGSLAGAAPVSGDGTLYFKVRDNESGVRAAALELDGRVVSTLHFNTPARSCAEPYVDFRPCPRTASGRFDLNTLPLTDGDHRVRLLTYDATAENVGVAGPWTITTKNETLASLCPSTTGPSVRARVRPNPVAYGRGTALAVRWPTIPWPAAEAVLLTGSRHVVPTRHAVRRSGNRFIVDVPAGVSRVVRMGFRSSGSRGAFVCSPPVRVRVRARVTLRARPTRVRNGQRIRISGRLAGGRRARRRSVILEARARYGGRAWVPVHVVRTGHRGRYHFSYRFRRTFQRTTFLFRARTQRARGFPFAAGRSRVRSVVVGP